MDKNLTISTPGPEWPSAAPAALLLVFGVTGNVLALIILCCSSKSHKWRPFYRFVCGLAITDGGGILLSYPIIMVRYGTEFKFNYPQPLCDYMAFIFMFTIFGSALFVCAMSLDRFIAILYPHFYNSLTKNRRVVSTIVGVWIFAAFLSSLHLIVGLKSQSFFPGSWCFLDFVEDGTSNRILALFYSLTGIMILITIIVLNTSVVIKVCYDSRQKKNMCITKKKNTYIMVFLFLIVILFTSCISPLLITIFGHAIGTISGNGLLELNAIRLSISNSIIDPWIYIVFRKDTFEFFKRMTLTLGLISESSSTSDTPSSNKENPSSDQIDSKSSKDLANPS
ncbi:prostaglandin E2 receptor EP4 subtype-like [Saccostrea echinata]|uniref:prostaglandin E2 receptor EP4 subtype-like n=1 Tax=Saccostrea echinata TaxID=191078 RepID=UPI002A8043C2|nr:prostaglandin E2 receptor EP4 subtype-like [Saccostrea echinata]